MIIRKSNPIPVRQDGAGGIPPALGVETCSAGSHPRAPRLPTSTGGSRGNLNNSVGCHGPALAKARDKFGENFAHEPRPIFGRHLVVPFNIITFHGGSCGD